MNWNLPSFEEAATLATEDHSRNRQRQHYSASETVTIRRRHLLEKKPVSDLGDPYGIHPTLLYRGQKAFFDNGAAAFAPSRTGRQAAEEAKDRTITTLEGKLPPKNESAPN